MTDLALAPARRARPVAGPGLEAGLVLCWSSGFIGGVLASEGGSIHAIMLWRFVVTALVLLPVAAPAVLGLPARAVARQALVGSLAMFGYLTGVNIAIDQGVPPGTVALITALQPMATAAVAGVALGETVGPRGWTGLAVGLAGVAVAVGGGLGTAPAAGYGLAFLSMACIVTATLVAKADGARPGLLPTLLIQSAISAALYLPLALHNDAVLPAMDADSVAAILWFVVFSTFGAYGFYWANVARSPATRVASLIYLTPPVTAVWALAMFGTPLGLPTLAGFAICLAGVWIAGAPRTG